MSLLVAATVPDMVTYAICALIVLSGAIGVIASRNAVHAALSLVLTLFGVAVLFIEQHAYFLAAVQVIVYAGAIVVLFLFVIMFLGVDRAEDLRAEPLKGQRPLALVLIAVALFGVLALAATANWVTGAHHVGGSLSAGHHTDTFLLGKSIFTTYLWAFEITAGLLVIAVVGAVVLARRPSNVHDERPTASSAAPGSVAGPPEPSAPGEVAAAPEPSAPGEVAAAPEPGADASQRVEVTP
jgi:NADH-quinone oxidoreductase subunit J